MFSIMNTGIPISFSFGKSETKELYEKHFQDFKNETGIDLCIYKFESDQGVDLQSIFKEKYIENFICLRHLLASIKYNQFSYAISIFKTLFFKYFKTKNNTKKIIRYINYIKNIIICIIFFRRGVCS